MTLTPQHVKDAARQLVRALGSCIVRLTSSPKGRILLFGLIGLSGFVPNLLTLALLTGVAHVNYVPATVVATQVAIIWNFLLLENVTYGPLRSGSPGRRVAQFFVLNNADLVLRIPLLAALVEFAHIGYLVATVLTLVVMFAVRFLATDRLIYRLRSRPDGSISLDFGVPAAGLGPLAAEEGRVTP